MDLSRAHQCQGWRAEREPIAVKLKVMGWPWPAARRKVKKYINEKIAGLYGHSDDRKRWFRDQFLSLFAGASILPWFATHFL